MTHQYEPQTLLLARDRQTDRTEQNRQLMGFYCLQDCQKSLSCPLWRTVKPVHELIHRIRSCKNVNCGKIDKQRAREAVQGIRAAVVSTSDEMTDEKSPI